MGEPPAVVSPAPAAHAFSVAAQAPAAHPSSASDSAGDRASTAPDSAGLDLRLLLPALAAWALTVAVLPHGAPAAWTAAAVGLALAVTVAAGGRSRMVARWSGGRVRVLGRWSGQLGLVGAAIALVSSATALHLSAASAGPVPTWAAGRAVSQVRLVVTTEPRVISRLDEREPLVVLEARVVEVAARGQVSHPRTPVVVLTSAGDGWEDVAWRSEVSVTGRWGLPDRPGRSVAVLTPHGPPTDVRAPPALLRWVDVVRERFRAAVDPLPQDPRGLVPGLVIGDTSLTSADLTQAMRDTGMTHLSAVSGSNVAIVVGGIALLAARLGLPRRWRLPVVLAGLVGFVLLCRPEPSVLRAGVMGVVGLLALTSGRRRASLPALAAAVIALLCLDPWLARSYGFALSTLATLGLVLWARHWGIALAGWLPRPAPRSLLAPVLPLLRLTARAAAVPLAAQVICAPVIVLLQGSITTVAVLANLLAAPLVPPTTILGVVAAVLSALWLPAAVAASWLAALPAWLIAQVARVCARLPVGTVDWLDGPLGAWSLALLTAVALVTGPWWWQQLRRRPLHGWVAAWVVLIAWWPTPVLSGWPPAGWVVAGCDVGQGDAFVVRTGERSALLVDVGPDPEAVGACLRDLGVERVDLLVLTHYHADHVAGLDGVLRSVPVGQALVTPLAEPAESAESALGDLAERAVPVSVARAGTVGAWGSATIRVVGPVDDRSRGESPANNASVVLDVVVEDVRVLLTGDLEEEGARAARAGLTGVDVDVLKVAHHGSAVQDEVLVRALDPEIALIGVGADNSFGHPAPSTLSLLAEVGAVVLRTDLHGDVAVVRDPAGRLVPHTRDRGGPAP